MKKRWIIFYIWFPNQKYDIWVMSNWLPLSNISPPNIHRISNISPIYLNFISIISQLYLNYISIESPKYLNFTSMISPSNLKYISTLSPSYLHHISIYPPPLVLAQIPESNPHLILINSRKSPEVKFKKQKDNLTSFEEHIW